MNIMRFTYNRGPWIGCKDLIVGHKKKHLFYDQTPSNNKKLRQHIDIKVNIKLLQIKTNPSDENLH